MTIGAITTSKPSVFDLISVKPAPEPIENAPRLDQADSDKRRGFSDYLRDAAPTDAKPPEDRGAEGADVGAVRDSQRDDQSAGDEAGAPQDKVEGNEVAPADRSDKQAQDDASGGDEVDADDSAELETQGQAVSNQDASEKTTTQQLTLAQSLAVAAAAQQSKASQGQPGTSTADQQVQAAVVQANIDSAARAKAQAATGPVQSPGTTLVQESLQQGAQSDSNSGDTRSESQATTQVSTTGPNASTNATAAQAFSLPDQANADAKLPINPSTTAQPVDASRLTQAQAMTSQSDSDGLNTARLTRGLANAVQQRGGAVTLRLTPPEMGTVRIQMQITGTNVSASFHAESSSAQTLLTQQLSQLRTALESQGMNVERLTVQPLAATSNSQNSSQSQNDGQQQNQAQHNNPGDGRSRGQYSGGGGQSSDGNGDGDAASQRQAARGFFDRLSDAADDAV